MFSVQNLSVDVLVEFLLSPCTETLNAMVASPRGFLAMQVNISLQLLR